MKRQLYRITLYSILTYLALSAPNLAGAATQPSEGNGPHFCGFTEQPDNRRYARSFAPNLNVGEPRTVRMIYFLPNDRLYGADVVQRMKDKILNIQTFYAEQMEAHGYGKVTFRVEADPQGEPMVHRVDGGHPDSHYLDNTHHTVLDEIDLVFNRGANIYLIVIDNSIIGLGHGANLRISGVGGRQGKNGGYALVHDEFSFELAAHELGHAFGSRHDFRDGGYIMSYGPAYGPGVNRLSACHAEFLSVHPYFNLNTPIKEGERPTIEIISPRTYPAGSQSVPVRLKVNDSEGLYQVILRALQPDNSGSVKACRGLGGKKEAVIEFDYDGVIPYAHDPSYSISTSLSDPVIHPIYVYVVDTDGDVSGASFELVEISPHHIATFDEHTSRVHSVAFSPVDAILLATGSQDGTVKLWNVVTQQDIATFRHTDEATSVSFSSDGAILATGSWDRTVKLWDVVTQQDIATLEGHMSRVHSVAFSPVDAILLATGSQDGTVKLWDVVTQQNIATLEGHMDQVTSVSFSPDGKTLASGSRDGMVKLWDVTTGANFATLPEHMGWVNSVAFSPDGTILASGGGGGIELWDVATETNFATLMHGAAVSSVSFSPDGGPLASGGRDGTVKLWDITARVNFATFTGHTDRVNSVAFSRDDTTLASGTQDGTVELWDTSGSMGVRLEAVSEINIPDPNLRAAIAEAIGLPPSTPIVRGYLEYLTRLKARNANISDLTGLEGATNLRILDLGAEYDRAEYRSINSNSVSDFSPLTGLTNLIALYLRDSNISDISTVAGLTNLNTLYLGSNSVSDISAVAGLTNLTRLYLGSNSISDISSVAGLTNLTKLYLGSNSVSDISAVAGLTNLRTLDLNRNSISDISPLVENTGLAGGDEVDIQLNPLSYQSIHTHIPAHSKQKGYSRV